MKRRVLLTGAVVLVASMGFAATAGRTTQPPEIDGKLDDACWKAAAWQSDFNRLSVYEKDHPEPQRGTAFAVLCDEANLYVAVRCTEPNVAEIVKRGNRTIWVTDDVELFFSPRGIPFEYYQFAMSPFSKDVACFFYSEGGIIQPDPYAPAWRQATHVGEGEWTVEFAIPLSGFYMTRNADWKTKWLVNVTRTMVGCPKNDDYTWSPLVSRFSEPNLFRKMDGFPMRAATDDVAVRDVTAEMTSAADGRLRGKLALTLHTSVAGRHVVRAAGCETALDLVAGANKVTVPCAYPSNGRHVTRFEVLAPGAMRPCLRDYPVLVDFQPVHVTLTKPGYRNNFYPGQNADSVEGSVAISGGGSAEVTLEGPGFTKRRATVANGGTFSFDTKGFAKGDAVLTVKAGQETKTVKIRNLPPKKGGMSWIENGALVLNGRPTLRRNIYALGYMTGLWQDEIFAKDRASFRMTEDFKAPELAALRLVPELEREEGTRDVYPSKRYFDAVDKVLEKNRESDVAAWFLIDEPECRNISPVWIRHQYEYIAEKDPYRVITTDSRGGKAYAECFDFIHTHPYLAPLNHADGSRTYGTPVRSIGSYVDAFGVGDRPDKSLGLVPMCFAYRWVSTANDYPTFAEYRASIWAGMIRGAKSLHVYAGHDLDDRPQLYHGTRYVFQSFEALEPLVLLGKRRTLVQDRDFETCLYESGDDKLAVAVNFTEKPVVAKLPGLTGRWREFRAARTFAGAALAAVELKPFETLVLTTKDHDRGLETLADVTARIDRLEYERTHRDNQLLERYNDIVFASNMDSNFGGGWYKLIDGTRDMLARSSNWRTNSFIEMSYPVFMPAFSKVRVWGAGLGGLSVSIRKDGAWRRLVPKTSKVERWMTELDFGETLTTVRLRLDLPGTGSPKNHVEIYEIELPRASGGEEMRRKVSAPTADAGVVACWSGTNCETSAKYSYTQWNKAGSVVPRAGGGFTFVANTDRAFPSKTDPKWIVLDFASIRPKPPGNQYRAWHFTVDPGGVIASLAGAAEEACVYTLELPKPTSDKLRWLVLRDYGLDIDMNSISLMGEPANRVVCRGPKDAKDVAPGDTIRVDVSFAEPCEEVAAEFLYAKARDDLKPFPLNGSPAIDLRPADDSGRNWEATIKVEKLPHAAAPRTVYVKASALGGAFKRPLIGNFTIPFVLAHEE